MVGSGKDKPVRKQLPDHLPRTTEEQAPACGCPNCGAALKRLGEDVSEYLELIPEHFKVVPVVRAVRPKMSCPKCSAWCRRQRRAGRFPSRSPAPQAFSRS
jgi:transposase